MPGLSALLAYAKRFLLDAAVAVVMLGIAHAYIMLQILGVAFQGRLVSAEPLPNRCQCGLSAVE